MVYRYLMEGLGRRQVTRYNGSWRWREKRGGEVEEGTKVSKHNSIKLLELHLAKQIDLWCCCCLLMHIEVVTVVPGELKPICWAVLYYLSHMLRAHLLHYQVEYCTHKPFSSLVFCRLSYSHISRKGRSPSSRF